MIQIEIPKDIRKYEAKLVGPLSTRQTVCVILASAIAVPIYFALDFLPSDFKYFFVAIFAVPILLCGWVKPYGMHLEEFIQVAFVSNILSPKCRIYKTENPYASVNKTKSKKELKKYKKKVKKISDKDLYPYQ